MSKAEPMIQKFMTVIPQSIEQDQSIAQAQTLMTKLKIRHLPVTEGGEVRGVISDRDIKMASGLLGTDPTKMQVQNICHKDPYCVNPETPLREVVLEMAQHHYGCAIVLQNHKLVGIFTTVDACRAISTILDQRFHAH